METGPTPIREYTFEELKQMGDAAIAESEIICAKVRQLLDETQRIQESNASPPKTRFQDSGLPIMQLDVIQ